MNSYMCNFGEVRADSISVYWSILEPTCIFSLLYTAIKISSISYPYQCLFAPSVQKGMGREKNWFALVGSSCITVYFGLCCIIR